MLLGNARIVSLEHDDAGILVHYRCWCGDLETFRTGRTRRRPVDDLL